MTKHIWISNEVCDQLNEYIEVFFDVDKLSAEDYLDIQNEIVLAGLNEVIARRSMEREVDG